MSQTFKELSDIDNRIDPETQGPQDRERHRHP